MYIYVLNDGGRGVACCPHHFSIQNYTIGHQLYNLLLSQRGLPAVRCPVMFLLTHFGSKTNDVRVNDALHGLPKLLCHLG